jgi:hypothetical protein
MNYREKARLILKVFILSGLLVLPIIFLFSGINRIDKTDSLLLEARQVTPLGKETIYYISKSRKLDYGENVVFPEGAIYEVTKVGDTRNLRFTGIGKSIGQSNVNLEPYLDLPVHIYGTVERRELNWLVPAEMVPEKWRHDKYYTIVVNNIELVEPI